MFVKGGFEKKSVKLEDLDRCRMETLENSYKNEFTVIHFDQTFKNFEGVLIKPVWGCLQNLLILVRKIHLTS